MLNRREAGLGLGAAFFFGQAANAATVADLDRAMAAIERESGGRLGVAWFDSGGGRQFAWRGDERFPMCSSFKLLLVAAVLEQVDRKAERLDRNIAIRQADMVSHAPVTGAHIGGELSVAALCEATLTLSDNPAANLLLERLGGPAGLTAFVRRHGDRITRLDRNEPLLNEALVGDMRDTTSPRAMVQTMRRLLLGTILSVASRDMLTTWIIANRTGDEQIRAGLPSGWRVGDKTGAGANGTNNDIAIIWPAGGSPWLLSIYLTGAKVDLAARKAAVASVARLIAHPPRS